MRFLNSRVSLLPTHTEQLGAFGKLCAVFAHAGNGARFSDYNTVDWISFRGFQRDFR